MIIHKIPFRHYLLGALVFLTTAHAQVDEKKLVQDYSTDYFFLLEKADSLTTVVTKGKGTILETGPDCLTSRELSKQLGDQAMVSNLDVYKQKQSFNRGLLLIANATMQLEYIFEALHFFLQTQDQKFLSNAIEGRKILERSGKEITKFRDSKQEGI